jgi:hypothetical protein
VTKTTLCFTLLITLSLLLSGCGSGSASPSALSDEDVLALATRLLVSIDDNNYDGFIADFSDEMVTAFPEAEFSELRDMLQSASGTFVSADELDLTNNQEYAIYRIRCSYSLEDVMVTLVFKVDGTLVEGLYFDSTNLRAASK